MLGAWQQFRRNLGNFKIQKIIKFHPKEGINTSTIENAMEKRLYKFKRGTIGDPGTGFIDFNPVEDFQNDLNYSDESVGEIINNSNNYMVKGYLQENWGEIYEYLEEEREIMEQKIGLLNIRSSLIIWNLELDHLFITGSDKLSNEIDASLIRMSQDFGIGNLENPSEFDPEFFFWLFWKSWCKETINTSIPTKIGLISDLATEGEKRDISGRKIDVKDSLDASKSLHTIITTLEGKTPNSIKLALTFSSEIHVTFELEKRGKITIFQSLGDLTQINRNDRGYVNWFCLTAIINLYEFWQGLEVKEKYLSLDFVKEIAKYSQEAGLDIYIGIPEILEKYKSLRGEE